MYDETKILELENNTLLVNSYYSLIQVGFNEFKINNNKDTGSISYIMTGTRIRIEDMRSILFDLATINHDPYIDYSLVINHMNYLRVKLDKSNLKFDKIIWSRLVEKIEKNGFPHLFSHLINKLRNIENKFERIAKDYMYLSHESIATFDYFLTRFGFYLREFVSCIQLTKVMLNHISRGKILLIATSPYKQEKTVRYKASLRLVVSN